MPNAPRDENSVIGKLAVLNTDTVQGTNLVPIAIDESTGEVLVNQADSINFTMVPVDPRDENYATCWLFQGSDGLTYPAVANSDGELLVDM